MIARLWRGRVPVSKGDAYARVLREEGTRDLRQTRGNRDVLILRQDGKDVTEFLLISLWESMDDIRRFAGSEPDKAVYYPWDRDYLLEFEPRVLHYEARSSLSEK